MTEALRADRRAHPRYSPDPWLPVVFLNPRDPLGLHSAGHIVDISSGGMRIVAPPTCTTPASWGATLEVTLSYSESNRRAGIEGLVVQANVVQVVSDGLQFSVRARFADPEVHERLVAYLNLLADGGGGPPADTFPPLDRC